MDVLTCVLHCDFAASSKVTVPGRCEGNVGAGLDSTEQ